jgi:hypothetical protein
MSSINDFQIGVICVSNFGNMDRTHIINITSVRIVMKTETCSTLFRHPILAKGDYYGIIVMILINRTKYHVYC